MANPKPLPSCMEVFSMPAASPPISSVMPPVPAAVSET
jgi:hypothetical protein